MFFTGRDFHKLDAKNRMRLPARLRKMIGDEKYYFCMGTENTIFVYTESELEKIYDRQREVRLSDTEAQNLVRAFNMNIYPVEEDAQGRIVVPNQFKEYARIKSDIVIIGNNTHIEIWSKESYDRRFGEGSGFDMNECFKAMGM